MAGTGLPASGLSYDEAAAKNGGGPFLEQASSSWSGSWI